MVRPMKKSFFTSLFSVFGIFFQHLSTSRTSRFYQVTTTKILVFSLFRPEVSSRRSVCTNVCYLGEARPQVTFQSDHADDRSPFFFFKSLTGDPTSFIQRVRSFQTADCPWCGAPPSLVGRMRDRPFAPFLTSKGPPGFLFRCNEEMTGPLFFRFRCRLRVDSFFLTGGAPIILDP